MKDYFFNSRTAEIFVKQQKLDYFVINFYLLSRAFTYKKILLTLYI